MHHDLYDSNEPLAHTRELCYGCHNHHHRPPLVGDAKKERRQEHNRKYRESRRTELCEKSIEYYTKNREAVLKKARERYAKRKLAN